MCDTLWYQPNNIKERKPSASFRVAEPRHRLAYTLPLWHTAASSAGQMRRVHTVLVALATRSRWCARCPHPCFLLTGTAVAGGE